MAAEPEITMKDLSGEWVMNKTLSDDTDAILAMQGVGWWMRKAISLATVTLHVKQYVDESGTTHIDIESTATGGIKGTAELRTLDWTPREHNDHIFGKLTGKSRWATLEDAEDEFLTEGWLEGEEENSGPEGQRHVQGNVVNEEKGWDAKQIWGFAVIDGKRYHTRRLVVSKGEEVRKARLVYNWQGRK